MIGIFGKLKWETLHLLKGMARIMLTNELNIPKTRPCRNQHPLIFLTLPPLTFQALPAFSAGRDKSINFAIFSDLMTSLVL